MVAIPNIIVRVFILIKISSHPGLRGGSDLNLSAQMGRGDGGEVPIREFRCVTLTQ
jgi:hypothetical protein